MTKFNTVVSLEMEIEAPDRVEADKVVRKKMVAFTGNVKVLSILDITHTIVNDETEAGKQRFVQTYTEKQEVYAKDEDEASEFFGDGQGEVTWSGEEIEQEDE